MYVLHTRAGLLRGENTLKRFDDKWQCSFLILRLRSWFASRTSYSTQDDALREVVFRPAGGGSFSAFSHGCEVSEKVVEDEKAHLRR